MSSGIRLLYNMPAKMDKDKPTVIIFYATPNGNTSEQTMGCQLVPEMDWHYDLQHAAAQIRLLRTLEKTRNIVLACVEPEGLSWPLWRKNNEDGDQVIHEVILGAIAKVPGRKVTAVVAGHSGGGSMIFGFINACSQIPACVERIAFLDANYSYSDHEKHGEKLIAWLSSNPDAHLVVLAYDDRYVTLNGKPVVSRTGGTYRATQRMISRFEKCYALSQFQFGEFNVYKFAGCNAYFYIHRNPRNEILHTSLVGDMNGLIHALTVGTAHSGQWGKLGGPRSYSRWIEPAPVSCSVIPPRANNARSAKVVMNQVSKMPLAQREAILEREFLAGNIPSFLSKFRPVKIRGKDVEGKEHTVVFYAMPDYLAIGTDRNFCRVPISPDLAQKIADEFLCTLPTRKIVDEIHKVAEIKLEPQPLTDKREAVETFLLHNSIIEAQRNKKPLGLIVSGIKKDLVITPLLQQRPDRVAIYGWHKLDGTPIQPLSTVHVRTYVDYSHGVRLIKRIALLDGHPTDIRDIVSSPVLHPLLSDEGPIEQPYYKSQGFRPCQNAEKYRLLKQP